MLESLSYDHPCTLGLTQIYNKYSHYSRLIKVTFFTIKSKQLQLVLPFMFVMILNNKLLLFFFYYSSKKHLFICYCFSFNIIFLCGIIHSRGNYTHRAQTHTHTYTRHYTHNYVISQINRYKYECLMINI